MARREKKYNYIYKTTCKVTNRFYIGMHSTDNLEDGYIGSGRVLWRPIRKHGLHEHEREILEFHPDRKTLRLREMEIVDRNMLDSNLCMNLVTGGGGGYTTENITDEHRNILRNNGKNAGELHKHRLNTDEEYKEKHASYAAANIKSAHRAGKIKYNTFEGKKHSHVTLEKLSSFGKSRIGKKNSQYGTCWITRDGLNKKIKRECIDEYIQAGWKAGRSIANGAVQGSTL